MDPEIKIDRRIRKTKQAIQQAVVKLLSDQNLESITITQVAAMADVNRKTFYNYYESTNQVLEEIENDIVQSFDEVISTINMKKDFKSPTWIFESLTNIIQQDFEFYSDLMQSNKVGDINLIAKISQTLKQRVIANLHLAIFEDDFTRDLTINYVIAGMMEVYQEWLRDPKKIPLDELSKKMSLITFSGVNGILGDGKNE